jgi:hypothetical protein
MRDPQYQDYIEMRPNLNMGESYQISDEITHILEPDNRTASVEDFQ